jgi:hypothetical protein
MTSKAPSRFGAFFARVETEREVLSIVNTAVSGPKLHGLTGAAIERWAAAVFATSPQRPEPIGEIAHLLHRIAIRAGAHADQSRVVFANEASPTLPVHDLVASLRNLCVNQCSATAPSRGMSGNT